MGKKKDRGYLRSDLFSLQIRRATDKRSEGKAFNADASGPISGIMARVVHKAIHYRSPTCRSASAEAIRVHPMGTAIRHHLSYSTREYTTIWVKFGYAWFSCIPHTGQWRKAKISPSSTICVGKSGQQQQCSVST